MSAISTEEAIARILALQSRSLQVGLYLDKDTEVSGGGYSRASVTLSNGAVVSGIGVRTANLNDLTFGPATESWGVIAWVKVHDTTANRVVYGGMIPASSQFNISTNQPYEIKAGSLGITLPTFDAT